MPQSPARRSASGALAVTIAPLLLLAGPGPPAPPAHGGGTAGPRPDLVVRVELHRELRSDGWLVRIRVDLRNAGNAPAGPSTVGTWCRAAEGGPCPVLDGTYDVGPPDSPRSTGVVRLSSPPLPPGGSAFVFGPRTKPWPTGSYVLGAAADVLSSVDESAEGNNAATASVRIP